MWLVLIKLYYHSYADDIRIGNENSGSAVAMDPSQPVASSFHLITLKVFTYFSEADHGE